MKILAIAIATVLLIGPAAAHRDTHYSADIYGPKGYKSQNRDCHIIHHRWTETHNCKISFDQSIIGTK